MKTLQILPPRLKPCPSNSNWMKSKGIVVWSCHDMSPHRLNPLSPNIHKQILQTGLHTFR